MWCDNPSNQTNDDENGQIGRFTRQAAAILALAAAIVIGATVILGQSESDEPGMFEIWVAPNGLDARATSSQQYPVKTLLRAQEILEAEDHDGLAVVYVEGGNYDEWGTTWSYQSEHRTIIKAYDGTPTFSGDGAKNQYGLLIEPDPGQPNDMNLSVEGLRWVDSTNGIRINGAFNVRLERLTFRRIGTQHSSTGNGYAALSLTGAQGTRVIEASFKDIENAEPNESYIHAIYMSDATHDTRVIDSRFSNVSGDPIRVRDGSNWNRVEGGSFSRTGKYAILSAWHNPGAGESPSAGNTLRNSDTGSDYAGSYDFPRTACFARGNDPLPQCAISSSGNY